eukprot:5438942-Prymnesium_polylepis.1
MAAHLLPSPRRPPQAGKLLKTEALDDTVASSITVRIYGGKGLQTGDSQDSAKLCMYGAGDGPDDCSTCADGSIEVTNLSPTGPDESAATDVLVTFTGDIPASQTVDDDASGYNICYKLAGGAYTKMIRSEASEDVRVAAVVPSAFAVTGDLEVGNTITLTFTGGEGLWAPAAGHSTTEGDAVYLINVAWECSEVSDKSPGSATSIAFGVST